MEDGEPQPRHSTAQHSRSTKSNDIQGCQDKGVDRGSIEARRVGRGDGTCSISTADTICRRWTFWIFGMSRLPINPTHRDVKLILYTRRICESKAKKTRSSLFLAYSLFKPLLLTSRTFLVYQLRNLCGESMLDKEYSKACDGCEGVSVGFQVYEKCIRT